MVRLTLFRFSLLCIWSNCVEQKAEAVARMSSTGRSRMLCPLIALLKLSCIDCIYIYIAYICVYIFIFFQLSANVFKDICIKHTDTHTLFWSGYSLFAFQTQWAKCNHCTLKTCLTLAPLKSHLGGSLIKRVANRSRWGFGKLMAFVKRRGGGFWGDWTGTGEGEGTTAERAGLVCAPGAIIRLLENNFE